MPLHHTMARRCDSALLKGFLPAWRFPVIQDGTFDLSAAPPFSLADLRNAIPVSRRGLCGCHRSTVGVGPSLFISAVAAAAAACHVPIYKHFHLVLMISTCMCVCHRCLLPRLFLQSHCWEKNAWRSFAHLALDVGIVAGLAVAAFAINQWCVSTCSHDALHETACATEKLAGGPKQSGFPCMCICISWPACILSNPRCAASAGGRGPCTGSHKAPCSGPCLWLATTGEFTPPTPRLGHRPRLRGRRRRPHPASRTHTTPHMPHAQPCAKPFLSYAWWH